MYTANDILKELHGMRNLTAIYDCGDAETFFRTSNATVNYYFKGKMVLQIRKSEEGYMIGVSYDGQELGHKVNTDDKHFHQAFQDLLRDVKDYQAMIKPTISTNMANRAEYLNIATTVEGLKYVFQYID